MGNCKSTSAAAATAPVAAEPAPAAATTGQDNGKQTQQHPAATIGLTASSAAPAEPTKLTIYEKLGGRDAVQAAVDLFYGKVLADERVNGFFNNTNMTKQRAKQFSFMCFAFGGPEAWKGRDMYEAHKGMGLTELHFNAIAEHFVATLKELNVPQDLIDEAVAVVASTKNQVLGLETADGMPVQAEPAAKCPVAH